MNILHFFASLIVDFLAFSVWKFTEERGSLDIDVARVQQYKSNVVQMFQQKGAKFKGTIREEPITGKQHFFERLGATAAVKRTTRHADTPLVSSPHTRRMVTLADYEWADLVDNQDKIRLLIDPASEYAINGADALGRGYDDEAILAFDADAKGGETGSTTVTFVSEAAGDEDFSAAALTLANIAQVKKDLDSKDVGPERFIAISPAALFQLLKQSTLPNFSSADYQMVKALVNGEINSGLGFNKWIMTTRLPSPAANMRYCYAWHRDAMGIALGKDITVDIGPRRDKSNATQVYICGTFGGTRVQGEGVVRFKIDETK